MWRCSTSCEPLARERKNPRKSGGFAVGLRKRFSNTRPGSPILLGFLITLVMEFFPVAFPVIAVEQLGAPAWLPSLANAGLAVLSSTLTGVAVALTSSRSRAFAVRLGAVLLLAWIASMAAVYAVPSAWLAVALFGSALIFGVGTVVLSTRMNAAASEVAPPEQAGRYLAAFQYSFSVASLTRLF
ncbi:MFS transporter [Microbacterium sp. NPDC078428]|uniref:MFS transporter n=1 Tax=Microbacterium sp. NPDC078428 TaxID=3364190 RepID=UPI0037C92609